MEAVEDTEEAAEDGEQAPTDEARQEGSEMTDQDAASVEEIMSDIGDEVNLLKSSNSFN